MRAVRSGGAGVDARSDRPVDEIRGADLPGLAIRDWPDLARRLLTAWLPSRRTGPDTLPSRGERFRRFAATGGEHPCTGGQLRWLVDDLLVTGQQPVGDVLGDTGAALVRSDPQAHPVRLHRQRAEVAEHRGHLERGGASLRWLVRNDGVCSVPGAVSRPGKRSGSRSPSCFPGGVGLPSGRGVGVRTRGVLERLDCRGGGEVRGVRGRRARAVHAPLW
jgi:hypothetical protein